MTQAKVPMRRGAKTPPPEKAPSRPPTVHRVYVIELRPEAGATRDPLYPPLYVGQSANTPEYRFAQHLTGGQLAADEVTRYRVRLRPDLYEHVKPSADHKSAEAREEATAKKLERRGHRVFWG